MKVAFPVQIRPIILLAIGGACLGSFPPLSKLGLQNGIPPISYMFYAAAGAGLALLLWTSLFDKAPLLSFWFLRYYVIAALTTFVVPSLATVIIVGEIGAGLVAISFTLVPVLTYIFAVLLKLERFARLRALGVIFGLAGAIIIYFPQTNTEGSSVSYWLIAALIIPLSLATGGIFRTMAWPETAAPMQLAAGMLITSALLLFPAVLWAGEAYWPFRFQTATDWIILFQILTAFLSYLILFEIQKSQGVVFQSLLGYVSTMTGVFVGYFLYKEHFPLIVWIALLLMLLGMAFVNYRRQ